MAKWILFVLLAIGTIGLASEWESDFKKNLKVNQDGLMDYNHLQLSMAVNSTSLSTIYGCPKIITKKFHNGGTVDTLVFVNCPQTNALWVVSGSDSLDGSISLADVCLAECNGDTLFIKRQAATGALRGYTAIRFR